jgi:hypothetical protein
VFNVGKRIEKLDLNYEFIKSIDDKFIEEFVNVPSGIPILLMNILEKVDPNIGLKRMLVFEKHPEYELLDRIESYNIRRLLKNNKIEESQEYHIKFALDFLEKYPKFNSILKKSSMTSISCR